MGDYNWSILDIMVISGNNGFKNGYVQKTQFSPRKEANDDDTSDAITNRDKFSPAWRVKYFGLYTCENGIWRVDKIFFGYNDVVYGQPQLRDDNSCDVDVLEIQYFESQDAFKLVIFQRYHYS